MLDTRRLAAELRCALDPVAFAVERLHFRPDPWQTKVMRSPATRLLLNCSPPRSPRGRKPGRAR
jgi:hypothetical protein